MSDLPAYPGTPRWVKIFGIVTLAVVLLIAIMLIGGHLGSGHGPQLHMQSGGSNSDMSTASATEGHMPSTGHGGN